MSLRSVTGLISDGTESGLLSESYFASSVCHGFNQNVHFTQVDRLYAIFIAGNYGLVHRCYRYDC
jgi:hypothetical protein